MAETKRINLLPKEEQRQLSWDLLSAHMISFWVMILISLGVLLVLALGERLYLSQQVSQYEAQIGEQKKVLASSDNEALRTQVTDLNNQVKAINNLRDNHMNWSDVFVAIANITPGDVQFNQISVDRATGRIDVVGQAKLREGILEFWSNIIKSDQFENINFPLTNLEKPKDAAFTFTFYVKKDKDQQ
jgi:hypothetical protein